MDPRSSARIAAWKQAGILGWSTLLIIWSAQVGWAQTESAPPRALEAPGGPSVGLQPPPLVDPNVNQASCPGCDSGLLGDRVKSGGGDGCLGCGDGPGGCGCGGPCCVPGRPCCKPCYSDFWLANCWCRFYECICCPDSCYEPRWVAAANAGFFVDHARPITHFLLRYDYNRDMDFPDRAEFFWARTGGAGKGPRLAEAALDYYELNMVTEVATGKFGVQFEYPYRLLKPEINASSSGFTDLKIATKTLLLDCELMQLTFQFRTFIPTGNFSRGLGTGHTALEPSLLCACKLTPNLYLESQLAEWIPLGGDTTYQGSILHYHFSLNKVLCRHPQDLQLIGTAELNGWYFQSGAFSNPLIVDGNGQPIPQRAGGETYLSAGAGLRLVMCNRLDLGCGAVFGLTDLGWYEELYRVEFRFRF